MVEVDKKLPKDSVVTSVAMDGPGAVVMTLPNERLDTGTEVIDGPGKVVMNSVEMILGPGTVLISVSETTDGPGRDVNIGVPTIAEAVVVTTLNC